MDEIDMEAKMTAYAQYHERMTEKTAGLGAKYFDRDARFTDPFYDVAGRTPIVQVFMERRQKPGFRFKIIDRMTGEDGHTCYWRWDRSHLEDGIKRTISGMSEVTFDLKGNVLSHVDFWDSGRAVLQHTWWGALVKRLHKTVR